MRSRTALAGAAGYGVLMLVTGVWLTGAALAAPAETTGPAPAAAALAQPTPLPTLVPSPVWSADPDDPVDPTEPQPQDPTGPSGSAKVPAARVASTAPGQSTSFTPAQLLLPNGKAAPVVPADVAPDGSLLIPENPQTVGYWTGGAHPGEPFGSVVIAGHVDSARFGVGFLYGIKGATAGQVLELRAGAQRMRYRVSATASVPQRSLAVDDADLFDQHGPPRLVVITCGGAFDPVRHHYQDNYIVVAEPLPWGN